MPWTNKGIVKMLDVFFRNGTEPANFLLLLSTNTTPPTADTNKVSEITEVAVTNGYTLGGQAVARDATDFDTETEDDTNDRGLVQMKDLSWTASGGTLPASGLGARWAILTSTLDTSGATATAASGDRCVLAYWDLGSAITLSDGQTLTLANLELRGNWTA